MSLMFNVIELFIIIKAYLNNIIIQIIKEMVNRFFDIHHI